MGERSLEFYYPCACAHSDFSSTLNPLHRLLTSGPPIQTTHFDIGHQETAKGDTKHGSLVLLTHESAEGKPIVCSLLTGYGTAPAQMRSPPGAHCRNHSLDEMTTV